MTDTGDQATGAVGSGAPINSQSTQAMAEDLNDVFQARLDAATAGMSAKVAVLEASVARDRETADRKRRKTEEKRVAADHKWATGRANQAVQTAIDTQYDIGHVLTGMRLIKTLLTQPSASAASAVDQGDQAAAGSSPVLLADLKQSDIANILRVVTEGETELDAKVAAAKADIAIYKAAEPWGVRGGPLLVQFMDCLASQHKRVDCPEFKQALALANSAARQAAADHGISKAVGGGGGGRGGGGGSHGKGRGRNRNRGTGGQGGRGGRGGKGGSANGGKDRAADDEADDSTEEVSYE